MIGEMRHLRAFLTVARLNNFTRAASELHISQSALTVQIRQLEDALGVMLFESQQAPGCAYPGRQRSVGAA
jgi:DNA-binding transcriptional LysR family regulator